jgi:hypothetical protein
VNKFLSRASTLALLLLASATPGFAKGGFGVTALPSAELFNWTAAPNAQLLVADFTGDGRDDFAVTGSSQFGTTLPLALSTGDGGVLTIQDDVGNFAVWATEAGVEILQGDFNDDGKADIALTGVSSWDSVPVAFSNGDGSFTVTNQPSDFADWAGNPAARFHVGDYNGDGKSDIAILGVPNQPVVPIAFSGGDGTFSVTIQTSVIAPWSCTAGAQAVLGDFSGDGKSDIALTGPASWGSVPVALSNGNGSFTVVNQALANFPGWVATAGVRILPGDYNGDHQLDIALSGNAQWQSVPVAFSNGNGTFNVTNLPVDSFPGYAATANATIYAGDLNGDGKTDLAVTGPTGWSSIPAAFSAGDGNFIATNQPIVSFGFWASLASTVTGDFNGDHKTDVAVIGPASWHNLPVAFSLTPP